MKHKMNLQGKTQSRILVVDDEESIRMVFSNILTDHGYSVMQAADHDAAITLIHKHSFDLIFIDIFLGKSSGLDLLKKLEIHCPIIMITGAPSIDTASEAVRSGAFDYVVKPIRKQTLIKITENALKYKALEDKKSEIESEKERYRNDLETIFSSLNEGIVSIDIDMRVSEANKAAEKICGIVSTNCCQKKITTLKLNCNKACHKILLQTLETKKPVQEYRIECLHKKRPDQVVLLTSQPLMDSEKKFRGAMLVIRDITKLDGLERELKNRYQFHNIIGKSKRMQEIYRLLENLSDTNTTVLITGESGTGKEIVARALHYGSTRSEKPLITVNCSALAENLLESELFGHVKGAFTGALYDKTGRFQMADNGTIFLDEIGEMSPMTQIKLLRVLQEKTFEPVGSSSSINVNVRVVAATNRDLWKKINAGEFRKDLYYRLDVMQINLPPLRERIEDIPLFIDHFLMTFNKRFHKNIIKISDSALKLFMNYPWPGNVRELEHAIERAFILCKGNMITEAHLPAAITNTSNETSTDSIYNKNRNLKNINRETLFHLLNKTDWNKAKTARLLGISRLTLYRKIKQFNINKTT